MKVILAPDSYKGALSPPEVAAAMETGLRRLWPGAEIVHLPIADGGEGTAAALAAATNGTLRKIRVTGPLGEPVNACWALLGDNETAVVELAQAAGLPQVPISRRDPKVTTTRGVGELLHAALHHPDVRRVIVGLGGSATNDGGAGLLQALGARLLDSNGNDLPPGGAHLANLIRAMRPDIPAWRNVEIAIACDVTNPLTGPSGASQIFGPQKGATPEDVQLLDAALQNFARVLNLPEQPGDGAAGGAAYGLRFLFPQATLRSGIDLVLDAVGFDQHLQSADFVLTGEGKIDQQTLGGKAVAGVARRAKAANIPVGALVGTIGDVTASELANAGIVAVQSIVPGPCTLEEALENSAVWTAAAAERCARWIGLYL